MPSDPATFLNQYLPLRLHPKVRRAIGSLIARVKPLGVHNTFYFGLVLAERTVVHTIKNDPRISIMASDINLILNYINSNFDILTEQSSLFVPICLPGMSEDYRLNLYV